MSVLADYFVFGKNKIAQLSFVAPNSEILSGSGAWSTVSAVVPEITNKFTKILAVGMTEEELPSSLFVKARFQENPRASISPSHFIPITELTNRHFIGYPMIQRDENPQKITAEEAWILGRYIASGRISCLHEVPVVGFYLANRKSCERIHSYVADFKATNAKRKKIYCRIFSDRLVSLCQKCGSMPNRHYIPAFIMQLPKTLLMRFVDGFLDRAEKLSDYQICIRGYEVAFAMQLLMSRLHSVPFLLSAFKHWQVPLKEVQQGKLYTLYGNVPARPMAKAFMDEEAVWLPVRSITNDEKQKEDSFCHLCLSDSSSYIINGIIVRSKGM